MKTKTATTWICLLLLALVGCTSADVPEQAAPDAHTIVDSGSPGTPDGDAMFTDETALDTFQTLDASNDDSEAAPETSVADDVETTPKVCAPLPKVTPSDVPTTPGRYVRSVEIAGSHRNYLLFVPSGYDHSNPRPLVLFFHGGGGSAQRAEKQRQDMIASAAAKNFILAFPDGYGKPNDDGHTWNGVHCCGPALTCNIDDVAFVDTLVKTLKLSLKIDDRRVYATGFSNGGIISHRLGAELPHVFAAIAPAGATIGGRAELNAPMVTIEPTGPISVLLMHGTLDVNVTFGGGWTKKETKNRYDISFKDSTTFWVTYNKCDPTPTVTEQQTTVGTVTTYSYTNCEAGVVVTAIAVGGVGHIWPSKAFAGGFDGTGTVLEFFASQLNPVN